MIIILLLALVCGLIGASMASTKNKPVAMWFFICFFFPIIGLIILSMSAPEQSFESKIASAIENSSTIRNTPHPPHTVPTKSYDLTKWNALKEYDPDVRSAFLKISSMGSKAEDRLATAFLAIGDRAMLDSIVQKIVADEEEAAQRTMRERQERDLSMTEEEKRYAMRREAASLAMIEALKANNMLLKYNNKRVKSAEMYQGSNNMWQGYALIIYEDGTRELRSGESWVAA